MADAVWHLGEIVVSEDDPATSLWPGHIFPPQTNVDCCEREQYKLGICSRGLNIYNSFQQGQGMPVVSANGLGHLLATEEMKGCSQPLFLTERLVPPAPWALPLPWPHSATASALFPSWETQQETCRGLDVKCGITSSLPTRVQNTFLQGCSHDWTVPPIRVWVLGLPGP